MGFEEKRDVIKEINDKIQVKHNLQRKLFDYQEKCMKPVSMIQIKSGINEEQEMN